MRKLLFAFSLIFIFGSASNAHALIITFSDDDYLGGASWGTMIITASDIDTLQIRYEASSSSIIPIGSQVTGFGFNFNPNSLIPVSVTNPLNEDILGDRDDLTWIILNNLNAVPTPANEDEFIIPPPHLEFNFGVTEGNSNNLNPPGISDGEFDVFFLNFSGVADLSTLDLNTLIDFSGIRLQSLPEDINGGSLFLAGGPTNIPEPGTMALLSAGLLGMGLLRRCRRRQESS